jgi:Heavy metal binding domain
MSESSTPAIAGGALITLCACLLLACSSHEKNDAPPAAAPVSTALPKYRGSATTKNGLHTEVAISAQGEYTVYFMDSAGDDLPAAQLSAVSVNGSALEINDTGETWIGKSSLPADNDLTAHVAFSVGGAPDSAAVALTSVDAPLDYVCPMDPDVRSATPGVCPRCGMKLVMGIPDPEEFPLRLDLSPAAPHPREKVDLIFSVENPDTGKTVEHFETVHERLFHLFIVSADLQFFVHDHPKYDGKGEFRYAATFPKPGMYRVLGDYYPAGATPQLAPKTIFVSGSPASLADAKLSPDLAPQKGQNSTVDLAMDAALAGAATRLSFRFTPSDGLERYLGAWAHMLAASDDLIDLLHEHPLSAGNGRIEFDLTFPRARIYRVWVQFQRDGVVNTVAFNVPVQEARP